MSSACEPRKPRPPAVYLDVDGVLNAYEMREFTPPKDCYTDFVDVRIRPTNGPAYTLVLSREMAEALADACVDAEVMWLTTWKRDAPAKVAPHLALPEWPWLDYDVNKVEAVIEDQLDGPRPFVWIDDVEVAGRRAERMRDRIAAALEEADEEMPPYLLIAPEARTGLQPSQIDELSAWLHEHVSSKDGEGGRA